MTAWNYLIPTRQEFPPGMSGRLHMGTDNMDWPHVGIYCAHDPHPWLLGSFTVSDTILEQRGTVYWGWARDYLCGNGDTIALGRQSGENGNTSLVENAVHDRKADGEALKRALAAGDVQRAALLSDQIDRDAANVRVKVNMACGICSLARGFRSDTLQPIVTRFWQAGIREIDFPLFIGRVDRRAKR